VIVEDTEGLSLQKVPAKHYNGNNIWFTHNFFICTQLTEISQFIKGKNATLDELPNITDLLKVKKVCDVV